MSPEAAIEVAAALATAGTRHRLDEVRVRIARHYLRRMPAIHRLPAEDLVHRLLLETGLGAVAR
jgi:hypothetical protein